jgi:hypothetical protein
VDTGQDTSLGARQPLSVDDCPPDLFFAQQVTTNACATQAILSVVFNANVDLGPTLTDFKSFTASFPPDLKGEIDWGIGGTSKGTQLFCAQGCVLE